MEVKLILAKVFEKLFVRPEGKLPEIVFSEKDHFPHKRFSVEWWYFTGFLNEDSVSDKPDSSGKEISRGSRPDGKANWQYAFEVTFFRARRPFEGRMLHIALYKLDNAEGAARFLYGESVSPCAGRKRKVSGGKAVVCVGNSYLAFNERKNTFIFDVEVPVRANAQNASKSKIVKKVRLKLEVSLHDVMPQGKNGVLQMAHGKGGSSYYFTYPNASVKGILEEGTGALKVRGTAWHDHQFGNFTVFDSAWDWFSLRFDEQKLYIMVFGFRKLKLFNFKKSAHPEETTSKEFSGKGEYTTTGNIFKDGKSISLEDVRIVPEEFFTFSSGAKYPLVWRISVFKDSTEVMRFRTEPLIKDCEFRSQFAPHYWEGPCKVSGEVLLPFEQEGVHFEKETLQGTAFVELVGYAR